jgi:hypothetical protein
MWALPLRPKPHAQPVGEIGQQVDRADPGTIGAAADQQVEQHDDGHPDQRQFFRHLPRQQRLEDDIGIGQRQEVQGVAEIQVALDDPDAEPGADEEQQQNTHLAAAAQEQPLVRGQPTLGGDGFDAGASG